LPGVDDSDHVRSVQHRYAKMLHSLSAAFLMYLSMHLAGSYFSVFLYEHGVSEAVIALSFSINMASQLLTVWPGGLFADRFGRLKAVSLGAVIYGAGILVLGLAPSIAAAILAAVLCGVGTSLISPFEAWLADAYRSEMEKALTSLRAIYFASGAAGGIIALLISRVSIRYIFFSSAAVSLLTVALLAALPEIRGLRSVGTVFKDLGGLLKNRAFLSVLLYSSALSGPLMVFYALWSVVLVERGLSKDLVGLVYTALLLSATAGSAATRRLLRGAGYVKMLAALSVLLGALFMASNTAQSTETTLALFLLLEFVLGALLATLSYARNRVVPPDIRASSLSLIDLASSLAALVLTPMIVQTFPETKLAIAGVIIMSSAAFLTISYYKT